MYTRPLSLKEELQPVSEGNARIPVLLTSRSSSSVIRNAPTLDGETDEYDAPG